ncbi:MAG: response regulator [Spirochaetia bacterium]|nr:response regulator [Spirochaetia bacterium]
MFEAGIHVLIVDPNPRDSAFLRDALIQTAGNNAQIKIVERLSGAQDALMSEDFDIIFLDLSLPDSHGLRSLNMLAHQAPHIPLYILTRLENDELVRLAKRKGAREYILKKFMSTDLLLKILTSLRDGTRVSLSSPARPSAAPAAPPGPDHKRILDVTTRYLSPEVRARAVAAVRQGQDVIGTEEADLTILFADIVGFTEMCEDMPLAEVIGLLNQAWEVVTNSINAMDGYVDKYMGDGVMAVFDDALSAVQAGVEIQNLFHQVNRFRNLSAMNPIYVRIGINSGHVIRGNIGTSARMDWTPLGDVVNTASRIQRHANASEVLLGNTTYERVKESVTLTRSDDVTFKGKKRSVRVHAVDTVRFESEGQTRILTTHPPDEEDEQLQAQDVKYSN